MNYLKNKLRKELFSKRISITSAESHLKSAIICNRLIRCIDYWEAKTVLFYLPIKKEVSTLPAIQLSLRHLKSLAAPCIENNSLIARSLNPNRLKIGKFGVPEPAKNCKKIGPKQIDLVIVPGIGFDSHGGRIGYGKGYYDKFLKKVPHAIKIALAYDFQVVAHFPKEPHDVHVDKIITEKRIIDCRKHRAQAKKIHF